MSKKFVIIRKKGKVIRQGKYLFGRVGVVYVYRKGRERGREGRREKGRARTYQDPLQW